MKTLPIFMLFDVCLFWIIQSANSTFLIDSNFVNFFKKFVDKFMSEQLIGMHSSIVKKRSSDDLRLLCRTFHEENLVNNHCISKLLSIWNSVSHSFFLLLNFRYKILSINFTAQRIYYKEIIRGNNCKNQRKRTSQWNRSYWLMLSFIP